MPGPVAFGARHVAPFSSARWAQRTALRFERPDLGWESIDEPDASAILRCGHQLCSAVFIRGEGVWGMGVYSFRRILRMRSVSAGSAGEGVAVDGAGEAVAMRYWPGEMELLWITVQM